MKILVVGAGVVGLACALELSLAGADVTVIDRGSRLGSNSCSWYAGGMLAPHCEGYDADPAVVRLGTTAIEWWRQHTEVFDTGSIVVAQGRDRSELNRFAKRTSGHRTLLQAEFKTLEPGLDGRFATGLLYEREAFLDPRTALQDLADALQRRGVAVEFGRDIATCPTVPEHIVDCRGLAARDVLTDLRGVKGEMLLIKTGELALQRPIRLLHPRIPLYIVPRGTDLFMVGATMIESDDRKRISVRSMIELLQAAYALHPIFAEAEIVEIGADVRPAFSDNLPKIRQIGNTTYVNGLYRHGFLLSPALAKMTVQLLLHNQSSEFVDEDSLQ